jgi:hypothetical protein
MTLPPELEHLAETLNAQLAGNPVLAPGQWRSIYEAFGADPASTRARQFTAIFTSAYVLPLWDDALPDDDLAPHLIDIAKHVLYDEIEIEEAQNEAVESHHILGNIVDFMAEDRGYDFRAEYAGLAALRTLEYVIAVITQGDSDEEHAGDGGTWNTVVASAYQAAAGSTDDGGAWSGEFDLAKSRAFWTWWLGEAIPKAWELAASEQE